MFSLRLRPRYKRWKNLPELTGVFRRRESSVPIDKSDEYSKYPEYPPIEPVTEEYLKEKEVKKWYAKIKRQKTVEEKLFEINMPRYWGWKCLMLKEGENPFNSLGFTKFATRTHLIETENLPIENYRSMECFEMARGLVPALEDIIRKNHMIAFDRMANEDLLTQRRKFTRCFIHDLNRLIFKSVNQENKNLWETEVDPSPRVEAFWYLGSLHEGVEELPCKYPRKDYKPPEEYLGKPSDKYIQYIGNPILQLRVEDPLPPVVELENCLYLEYPLETYPYDPFVIFGYEMARRHVTNIPGFWPGEKREFSYLSYHDICDVEFRPKAYGEEDAKEAIQARAILASYGWLTSLSSYQGFTTFHEVTYPFVTHTVLTNGTEFVFAVYQLSTTEMYHKNPFVNPKCNLCWITPKKSLFTFSDGVITGWDLNVLKLLLEFYTSNLWKDQNIVRKPYLDSRNSLVAMYEDDEKREWLEKNFKHFSSNRPRHRVDLMYELHDYERIYKVMFQTMPRDKKVRPFELRQNPFLRKMNDHVPAYIPRGLRPDKDLPKYKQRKFSKTYYPE